MRNLIIYEKVGGATARAGDPSFREHAKVRLDDKTLIANTESIKNQLSLLMTNGLIRATFHHHQTIVPEISVVDNYEWQKEIRLLDFLDSVGTQMRLSSMLNRESVQRRISSSAGMSFTEFTYQLLQGYDFYHLFKERNCMMQLGGSDQWGNIVAGVEMIGRLRPDSTGLVSAMTFPLLMDSNGEKMGKSNGNAVWLDKEMTSPYDLYQYLVRMSDADCSLLLKSLTFLSDEELSTLVEQHNQEPEARKMQRVLAFEVTAFVHGEEEANRAIKVSSLFFESHADSIFNNPSDHELLTRVLRQSGRRHHMDSERHQSLLSLLRKLMPKQSNNALRTLAKSGGVYINGQRVEDLHSPIILPNPTFLRLGKHTHFLLERNNV
jgi:tyrosyl-tRNA synthetase